MNTTINSYLNGIKNNKKENEERREALITKANMAYAEILSAFRQNLSILPTHPLDVKRHIEAIETARAEGAQTVGIKLLPAFQEPEMEGGQRRDFLTPSGGGYTFSSFVGRLMHLLRFLERRTPGCAPDLKKAAPQQPRKVVEKVAPAPVAKEEPRETVGDFAALTLPPRKRGAESAAMRKLREAQEKRS